MNDHVSKYKVIKNFENHLKIIQKLLENGLEFSDALEFDLDTFKNFLNDFDESMIESFFTDLQSYKESQNTPLIHGYSLKEFDNYREICKKLIEKELTLENAINLDDENIRIYLADLDDQSQISLFVSVLEKIKCSKKDEKCDKEIFNYFHSKNLSPEFNTIISKIDEKISLNDLLEMSKKNKLTEFLKKFESETDSVKKDFISVLELECFFDSNNLSKETFQNLKKFLMKKKIYLNVLSSYSKNKKLEFFLLLKITKFSEETIEDLLTKTIFSNLQINIVEELKKVVLGETERKVLSNLLSFLKQCQIRRISIFNVNEIFLSYVLENELTFKNIDIWTIDDFNKKVPDLKEKEILIQLIKQKSQVEIFLEDVKINLEKTDLDNLRYIDFERIKTYKLSNFEKISPINLKQYKEIIAKSKTYDPQSKFDSENFITELETKLNSLLN